MGLFSRAVVAGTLSVLLAGAAKAQETRLTLVGEVAPRHAREITGNNWSIGAETIDRDFSTYDAWKAHLGPLGAKHARLQSGWARTDKGSGQYDYAWLDPIVADMLAQGVTPWVSLGYGNPAYEGGGSAQRDTDLPSGAGRRAWLAYVRATVTRYKGRVGAWELWNEPDLINKFDARTFGLFAAETAQAVRQADPAAEIIVAGYTGVGDRSREYILESLRAFYGAGGRGLAKAVIFHAYAPNPDTVYPGVERLRADMRLIDPALEIRQGESGAPSINQQLFAMRNIWWTEESQAKFLLRRMIGDAAHGIWTSVFTLTDLHYSVQAERTASFAGPQARTASVAVNTKGLLETRRYGSGAEDDRTVVRTKTGYRAMQAVTAIMDLRLTPSPGACTASSPSVSAYAFRRDDGAVLVAAWRSTDRPGENPDHENVDVRCPGLHFAGEAVYVDPLTSMVYRAPEVIERGGSGVTLRALPIYDAPVLVADQALVPVW